MSVVMSDVMSEVVSEFMSDIISDVMSYKDPKRIVNWLFRSELNSCADNRFLKNYKVIKNALPTDTMSLVSAINLLECPWL